jgi:hypothetical protein
LHAFVAIAAIHTSELLGIIFPITMLLIFRLMLRRTGPAIATVSLLAIIMFYPDSGNIPGYLVTYCLLAAIFWIVLFRAGLLALATMMSVSSLLADIPLTPHPEGWYLGGMLLALAFIVAPALYGFWTSQAGRPLFRDEILEPAVRT